MYKLTRIIPYKLYMCKIFRKNGYLFLLVITQEK
jgi:hypothetical protein